MKSKTPLVGALALVFVAILLALAAIFAARPPAVEKRTANAAADRPAMQSMRADAADPASAPETPAAQTAPVGQPVAQQSAASPGAAAAAVNSPAASNVRSTTLPSSTAAVRHVSAEAAASLGLVPDPNSGPAWPTGFTEFRTPAEILAGKDLTDPQQRAQVVAEMSEAEEVRYTAVLAKADQLGIPVRIEGPGHNVAILYDFRGESPLYRKTLNTNAAITTGANLLNIAPYNLTGAGMTAGVWDEARARTNHVELSGKVTIKDGTTTNSDHATHVAGTIAGKGVNAKAKGMGTNTLINSYDWNNDYAEMTGAGAATAADAAKLPLSNHSYGYDAKAADMGRYETEARSTDAVAAALPYYQIFWAAGNEQDVLTSLGGYQSITFNGLAKNVISVGAVSMAVNNGYRDPSQSTLAYFSSMGPCDDGRIKPDVVADGVNVFSSVATTTNSYDTYSGTSMATPNAVGTSALLIQLYKASFSGKLPPASMLKALLIHTADDMGRPGPDYQFGWGLINAKAAADVILAHKASPGSPKLIEGAVTATNKVQNFSFSWDGTSPIRATLAWTDPPGVAQTASNSRTRNLINDLDLKVTAPNGADSLPYVMPFVGAWTTASMTNHATTGTNKVDNVERVDIATPAQPGTYTVSVGMYGTNVLTGSSQAYSLIVTGGADIPVNPPPVVTLDSPANDTAVLSGTQVNLAATATDLDINGNPGVVAKVEFFNGNTLIATDTSAPYAATWTPPGSGTYNISARATDSEGAVGTSATSRLIVMSGDGKPVITDFSPGSGVSGDLVTITGSNFSGVTAVKFNGLDAASYTVTSETQIMAVVPTGVSAGPITVVNAFGSVVSGGNFTVVVSPVLISQVYGAGGNTGAAFNADFVELFNRSGSPVNLSGWSMQYASASGITWAVGTLSGTIAPGKYFLIKLAGGGSGSALPTPDATPGASINMSGTSGKIALMNTGTQLSGSSPIGAPGLQDFVGYGSANAYRIAPAPSPSTTTSIFRLGGGATDTGNNSADFEALTPNPRNSAYGGAGVPVITSPLTASGTVGTLFSYQITASNSPLSFGAVGLPAGLAVNASSGLISGTPTIAGTYNVTISAVNGSGSDSKTLVITVNPSGGGGGGTQIFSEDFVSVTSGNSTSTSGSSTSWSGNTNFPTVSGVYQAGGAVRLGSGSSAGSITSRALDLSTGGGGFTVSFKVKGWATVEGPLTVTVTGQTPQVVTYAAAMSGAFEAKTLNFNGGVANATVTLQTASGKRAFVDDVVVAVSSSEATIVASGSISAVHTVYGTASPIPSSVSVSGANMTQGILVTPPPGFEVSQTPGGASGYAATQTIGAAGTIAPTDVFVRLAAGTSAGAYSGNLVCSSAGAASVNVAIPSSNVRQQNLTVTANDQAKSFGQTLTLGAGQTAFTSSGLVLGQTIGTVTLTASGGTAAGDASGTYKITPSEAAGGTFGVENYEVSYEPGTLTVLGEPYSSWSDGLSDPSPGADIDGDGIPNVVEYFMGLNAEAPDSGVSFSYANGVMTLDYRRNKNMQGLSGAVKWHTSLTDAAPWSTNDVTDVFLSDHGTYQLRRATLPVPPEEGHRFMRLEITTP